MFDSSTEGQSRRKTVGLVIASVTLVSGMLGFVVPSASAALNDDCIPPTQQSAAMKAGGTTSAQSDTKDVTALDDSSTLTETGKGSSKTDVSTDSKEELKSPDTKSPKDITSTDDKGFDDKSTTDKDKTIDNDKVAITDKSSTKDTSEKDKTNVLQEPTTSDTTTGLTDKDLVPPSSTTTDTQSTVGDKETSTDSGTSALPKIPKQQSTTDNSSVTPIADPSATVTDTDDTVTPALSTNEVDKNTSDPTTPTDTKTKTSGDKNVCVDKSPATKAKDKVWQAEEPEVVATNETPTVKTVEKDSGSVTVDAPLKIQNNKIVNNNTVNNNTTVNNKTVNTNTAVTQDNSRHVVVNKTPDTTVTTIAADKTATTKASTPKTTKETVTVETKKVEPKAEPKKAEPTEDAVKNDTQTEVVIEKSCKTVDSGWKMKWNNKGHDDASLHIKQKGGSSNVVAVGAVVNVKAGDSGEKEFAFKGVSSFGGVVNIDVATDEAAKHVIKKEKVSNDCVEAPKASMKAVCDTNKGNGAIITFNNKTKDDQKFTVTRDGKDVEGSPFTMKSGSEDVRKFLKIDGTGAKIKVSNGAGFDHEEELKTDCKAATPADLGTTTTKSGSDTKVEIVPAPEVKADTAVKTETKSLAATGLALSKAVFFASLLTGLGFTALHLRNRRKYQL